MIIHLYTLCWNEIDILPFVVDYWEKLNVSKAVVFDNGSTDGSVEYLEQFNWIEVRSFNTNGLNNEILIEIKNEAWKESIGKADYVIVCDTDECLISPFGKNTFIEMKNSGYTICAPKWYEFISEYEPQYVKGKLLHEISERAFSMNSSKVILFNPNEIKEINYNPGAHSCNPEGNIKYYYGELYLLHINKRLSLDFFINKFRILNDRRSPSDVKHSYGCHYSFSEDKLISEYNDDFRRSINFNMLINNLIKNNKI